LSPRRRAEQDKLALAEQDKLALAEQDKLALAEQELQVLPRLCSRIEC
jgi:hypothetical protein